MKLTPEDQKMLDGDYGAGVQKAMTMIVRFGELFDAEKTVPLASVHHLPMEPLDWLEEVSEGVTEVRSFTGTHASYFDPTRWEALGIPEKFGTRQGASFKKRDEIYRSMGMLPTYTCAPYSVGNVPKMGSYFAWGGSAGQTLANSLLGARGDRVGGPLILAGAITGRAPCTGLMRPENRYGQFLVEIGNDLNPEELNYADWGAISYYLGDLAGARNVVFNGLPENTSFETLKYLFSPLPVSGATALCHVVGVTPEAPTLEAALGNRKPEESIVVSRKELQQGWESLHTAESKDVDVVAFGCPHCTISEIQQIAAWLEGKKINANVKLWIATANQTRFLAENAGLAQIIEEAGGVLTSVCIGGASPMQISGVSADVLAVDSPRAAHYVYRNTEGRKKSLTAAGKRA